MLPENTAVAAPTAAPTAASVVQPPEPLGCLKSCFCPAALVAINFSLLNDEYRAVDSPDPENATLMCSSLIPQLKRLGANGRKSYRLLCKMQLFCFCLCGGMPILVAAHMVQRRQLRDKYALDPETPFCLHSLLGALLCLPCGVLDTQRTILKGRRLPTHVLTTSNGSPTLFMQPAMREVLLASGQVARPAGPGAPGGGTRGRRVHMHSRSGRAMSFIQESDETNELAEEADISSHPASASNSQHHPSSMARGQPRSKHVSFNATQSPAMSQGSGEITPDPNQPSLWPRSNGSNGSLVAQLAHEMLSSEADAAYVADRLAMMQGTQLAAAAARRPGSAPVAPGFVERHNVQVSTTHSGEPLAVTKMESDSPVMEAALRAAVDEQRRQNQKIQRGEIARVNNTADAAVQAVAQFPPLVGPLASSPVTVEGPACAPPDLPATALLASYEAPCDALVLPPSVKAGRFDASAVGDGYDDPVLAFEAALVEEMAAGDAASQQIQISEGAATSDVAGGPGQQTLVDAAVSVTPCSTPSVDPPVPHIELSAGQYGKASLQHAAGKGGATPNVDSAGSGSNGSVNCTAHITNTSMPSTCSPVLAGLTIRPRSG